MRLMWCSRQWLATPATSVACLWHVSVAGGARRRGCAATGVSGFFNGLPSVRAMASIRVGVQVQPQHADFDGMRRAWREAEELGVDSIFCWDHFFPLYGEADG